jgi:hypothetical protein
MPITVRVLDPAFQVLDERELPVELERLLLDGASPSGPLRHIDEYGDTYFNSLQVRDAVPELAALRDRPDTGPAAKDALSDLIRLASLAVAEPHRFLYFEGD